MKRLRVAFVLVMVLLLTPVFAEELVAPEDEARPQDASLSHGDARTWATTGFIFNTSSLLLDVDAYRGGLGVKYRTPLAAVRLLASLGYESGTGASETRFGLTYERPFFTGRVTPYWGLFADVGFESERSEADEESLSHARVRSGTTGGVLGVDMLIFDFLSVFAEYQLGLRVARTVTEQRVEGELEKAVSWSVASGAGIGNNGSLGVVLYLRPLGILDSDRDDE